MGQQRLNNIMILKLYICKGKMDKLSMINVANKSVNDEHRLSHLGKLTDWL